MRTKALLLTAAIAAAGVATSMAQVFSVNAVGYVNVSLTPGFNMVSNPLQAADNTIGALFANISPSIPSGLKIFAFDSAAGSFAPTVTYLGIPFNSFQPPADAQRVLPVGDGAFVFDPRTTGSNPLTLTFVGEVRQGELNNTLPQGFSIKANMVPQAGRPTAFGFPATGGDKVFKFNKTTGGYDTYSYLGFPFNSWSGPNGATDLPVIEVGEAFFVFRANSAGTWTRTFNVNAN